MRIAIDANPLLRGRTTGIPNHARGICGALAEMARRDDTFLLVYEAAAEEHDGFNDAFVRSLPPNWQLLSANVLGPTAATARYCWEHWGLPKLLKKHHADVYYSTSTLGPYTKHCPKAITIHDLAKEATGHSRKVPRAVARLAAKADRIFVVSDATARDVRRILRIEPWRLVTIHNAPAPGIAPAHARRQRDVCDKYDLRPGKFLLCVGDENWRRRYEMLWETMDSFWSTGHLESIRVVFVGREDWRQTDLYARMRSGSWRDGGVFLNNIDDHDLGALYSAAMVTVVPTVAEGFGMPVVEAMACACPVLCSDLPVLREVAGQAVQYFDPHSPESLADGIRLVTGDEPLRAKLTRRGLVCAARYTWQAAAEKVLATLRGLVEGAEC